MSRIDQLLELIEAARHRGDLEPLELIEAALVKAAHRRGCAMGFAYHTLVLIHVWALFCSGRMESLVDGIIKEGRATLYPASRLAREIAAEVKKRSPETELICLDPLPEGHLPGVPVYPLHPLDSSKARTSLLVVCSNYFTTREWDHSLEAHFPQVVRVTRMDTTLPQHRNITGEILHILDRLADEKSRAVYLISWLARALDDESLTHLFQSDEETAGVTVAGLTEVCQKEALSDLYQMKDVRVEEGDVVFDVGAYRGENAILFARKARTVYAFEPVEANYYRLLLNIGGYRNIVAVEAACSGVTGNLSMVSVPGGAPWSFVGDGERQVKALAIDDFVEQASIDRVDFIKIDAEGWETSVLTGAMKTIARFRPKLAVCLYHQTSDMLDVPLLVHSMASYRMYMRCKIEGPYGLMMYCAR